MYQKFLYEKFRVWDKKEKKYIVHFYFPKGDLAITPFGQLLRTIFDEETGTYDVVILDPYRYIFEEIIINDPSNNRILYFNDVIEISGKKYILDPEMSVASLIKEYSLIDFPPKWKLIGNIHMAPEGNK